MPPDIRIRDCRIDQVADDEICLAIGITDGIVGRARFRGTGIPVAGLREAAETLIGRSPYARHPRLETESLLIADPAGRRIVGALEAARCDAVGKVLGSPLHAWFGGALRAELAVAASMPLAASAAVDKSIDMCRAVLTNADRGLDATIQLLCQVCGRLGDGIEVALQLAGQCDAAQIAPLLAAARDLRLVYIADPCADALAASRAFAAGLPALALTAHRYPVASLQPALAAGGVQMLLLDPIAIGGPEAVRALATLAQLNGIDVGLSAAGGTPWQARYAGAIGATVAAATEPLVVDMAIAGKLRLRHGRLTLGTQPGIEDEPATAPALERAAP